MPPEISRGRARTPAPCYPARVQTPNRLLCLTSVLLATTASLLVGCPAPAGGEDDPMVSQPLPQNQAAQEMAEELCEAFFECDCDASLLYADVSACVDAIQPVVQAEFDDLLAGGGTWDDDCAGDMLFTWQQWDCLGPTEALKQASFDPRVCPLAHGTLGEGEFCDSTYLGDPCAEGLGCWDEVCIVAPNIPVPAGGVCEIGWQDLPCESGTYCTWTEASETQICVPWPVEGDPCEWEGSTCGPAALDLICSATLRCEPAPGVGESCEQGICAPGLYCDGGKDFTCQERFEVGDPCGADAVCPVDASCVNNVCVADPAAICGVNF